MEGGGSSRAARASQRLERWADPGNPGADVAGLGVDLQGVDVRQREADHVHVRGRRRQGRQPNEDREVAGVASVEVANAHLIAAARRQLVVVEQRVQLLDLGAAHRLDAQLHPLGHHLPGPPAPQGWPYSPSQAAALEAADVQGLRAACGGLPPSAAERAARAAAHMGAVGAGNSGGRPAAQLQGGERRRGDRGHEHDGPRLPGRQGLAFGREAQVAHQKALQPGAAKERPCQESKSFLTKSYVRAGG